MPHALVVDDEADSAEMMATLIAMEGFTVATAGSLRDARKQLALQEPDIVLLDLMLPDGSGMQLFDDGKSLVNTEVVLITGHASLETSIQALRLGAVDYLVKPVNMKQLHGILSRVTKPSALKAEAADLQTGLEEEGHFGLLWGRSAVMRQVYEQILRVSGTAVTVFITGESGSGKEVVASTVHDLSRRRGRPFLGVNCGAISPHLIESEIFGHEKGSFTGADRQHQGFFERASGGTLFLDEVTEMPLDLQVKLLRVLETGTFMRVGSTQIQETDVRIIAATNRPPMQAVRDGKLREDLLYRLNVFPIHLPALRERAGDVPLIAQHFLQEISRREGQLKTFDPQALRRLSDFGWPGNVRELRNIVHRAYVMARGSVIVDECLPTTDTPLPVLTGAPILSIRVGTTLAEIERQVTLATLEYLGRHKEKTAATLGVSLKTLYNRLKEYSTVPVSLDGDLPPGSSSWGDLGH
ncbi:sigma-54 dependent transcriptional regulator [Aquabacterium sp.]|uniref:sigma-54-dependent transcriptional regulator n=1 Tax=Aquabacterium sp. TaxID=1872578 RepID=UPI00199628DD|nr:sigma-54 dependent transcriptional regulator [Aquabacterium sp.]MBC7702235.1 sigma-54-dependent Fis family transcriptional regulator [Aquabacterium sp.]